MENYSGAYIISRQRRGRGKPPHRKKRGAAALIAILLLLTSGIVLLAVILPRLPTGSEKVSGGNASVGRTFYLLSMGGSDDYTEVSMYAQDAASRGGGGYIYNDGRYHAIAAVYGKESDAKAIAEINDGAYYIALTVPQPTDGNDAEIAKYVCGEFFTALDNAAAALDRGTTTNAAADYVVYESIMRLNGMLGNASYSLRFALEDGIEYKPGGGDRTQLSYIRYVIIKTVIGTYDGLRFAV